MTADLVAFLNARLAEDEADARAAFAHSLSAQRRGQPEFSGQWTQLVDDVVRPEDGMIVGPKFWPPAVPHVLRHDPARVLADVQSKRAILDELTTAAAELKEAGVGADMRVIGRFEGLLAAAELLANAHADHPDFRPEWGVSPDDRGVHPA